MSDDWNLFQDEHERSLHDLLKAKRIPPQPELDDMPPPQPDGYTFTEEEQAAGLEHVTQIRALIEEAKKTRPSWSKQARAAEAG